MLTTISHQNHVPDQMGRHTRGAAVLGDFACHFVRGSDLEYQQEPLVGGLFARYTVDNAGGEYSQVCVSFLGFTEVITLC